MAKYLLINQYASTPEFGMGGRHYYLGKSLANRGHKVTLVMASYSHLLRKVPAVSQRYTYEKVNENFDVLWVKMPRYANAHSCGRILNWFLFSFYLMRMDSFLKRAPDGILFSSPSLVPFLGAEYLAKKNKCRLVFEVRDIWPLTLQKIGGYSRWNPFIVFLRFIEKRAYRLSDLVVSNLPYAYEHMEMSGLKKGRFAWIPNGFDNEELVSAQPLSCDVENILPKDKFIVGYTGTLGMANALDVFVDAARLLSEDSEILFLIVGEGKDQKKLKERAAGLKNVVFIPAIPKTQVQSMLAKFSVCYIGGNSRSDLYKYGVSPNKLYEYLFSGKPILYALNSGRYNPISESGAGLVCEEITPEELSRRVLELKALSSDERIKMGTRGKEYVIANHNYDNLAITLEEAFR